MAQATVAIPGYFSPVKIDGEEFLDGAFGVNNPSHLATNELSTIHDKNGICLVSIGSGRYESLSRSHSSQLRRWVSFFKPAVEFTTDSEHVHRHMLDLAKVPEMCFYFRFDVPGLEDIAMDQLVLKNSGKRLQSEERNTIAFIRARTQEYLIQAETHESIKSCARMIIESRSRQEYVSARSHPNSTNAKLNNVSIPQNSTFRGRKEILADMYIHLRPHSRRIDARLQTCLLYGSRGIGKTQIAVEYCYRHKVEYDCIFWIEASTEVDLAESYNSILKLINPHHGLTGTETAIQMVNQWLADTGQLSISFLLSSTRFFTDGNTF